MTEKYATKLRRRAKREERQRDKAIRAANPPKQSAGQRKPTGQKASTTRSGSGDATTPRTSNSPAR
jgi:hypothetical protein